MSDAGIRFESLPSQTRRWIVAGNVEVVYCRNIGPYRKLLPILDRYGVGDYYIATADDDVLYPPDWLEILLKTADSNDCVAAYRCRFMGRSNSSLTPYNSWPLILGDEDLVGRGVKKGDASNKLFPTGRDGVIYQASFFNDLGALRALQIIAPAQDDITFKLMTLMAGIPVMRAPREITKKPELPEFPAAKVIGPTLWHSNSSGDNDKVFEHALDWCRKYRSYDIDI